MYFFAVRWANAQSDYHALTFLMRWKKQILPSVKFPACFFCVFKYFH